MIAALMVEDARREDDVLFLTIDVPRAIAEACTPSCDIACESTAFVITNAAGQLLLLLLQQQQQQQQ